MEALGMLISTAGMIGFFVGLWQWRRASKAKQNTRQPKTITGVSVILFFIGAGLLGSTSLLGTIGVLLSVCGGYFLITSIWHLIRSRKTGAGKRRSVIIAVSAAVVFGIGSTMVTASPEGKEEAARSEKVAEQAKAQSAAAESSKKTAAERAAAKTKQDAKKQAKALAKSQSRSKAAAKSSRKAVATAKRAKAAKAAAASSKSTRQAAESSSRAKALSESSAAASSSIAQAAAVSSSQTTAASESKAQEAAAASSQAAVTETAGQTDNDQQTVYATTSGNKYHFDRGCRGLRRANSVFTMTLAEARLNGYSKCAFE